MTFQRIQFSSPKTGTILQTDATRLQPGSVLRENSKPRDLLKNCFSLFASIPRLFEWASTKFKFIHMETYRQPLAVDRDSSKLKLFKACNRLLQVSSFPGPLITSYNKHRSHIQVRPSYSSFSLSCHTNLVALRPIFQETGIPPTISLKHRQRIENE